MIYAGIGARITPPDVLEVMTRLGAVLAKAGFTLRSGAASGADRAFESGACSVGGRREIYLPFAGFQGHDSSLFNVGEGAMELAARFHPAWDQLSPTVKRLHGRNAYQVLGVQLDRPADFVICWTPDGCVSHANRRRSTGGTGTAISIADAYRVPVFNLQNGASRAALAGRLAHLSEVEGSLAKIAASPVAWRQDSLF